MPLFDYIANSKEGDKVRGVVEAASVDIALDTLKDKGFLVLSLNEREEKKGFSVEITWFSRIKIKDIVIFSRQLAVMVSANLPIVQALRILTKQTESVKLKIVISEVADAVDGGMRLSAALAKYPSAFSNFFVSMVRSGETAGKVDEVLNYLADQMEKDYDLMSKVKGAMTYPAFILFGLVAAGVVMMIFVIPKLTELLKESGAKLPLTTRILIGTSSFMTAYWWLILLAVIGAGLAFVYWRRTEAGHKQIDYLMLKAPIFGPLILQKIFLVRLTRSLFTLLSGGVSLTEALKITGEVVGNEVYREVIEKTVKEVEDGNPIASVFSQSAAVPVMMSQMLAVGEQTGRLDLVLQKLSDFYGREVDNSVANLVTLIEPLILLLMGGAVGLMVAAIMLPLFSLSANIS